MNLASLSTLDANDPLPLALGPRHEPPVPVAGAAASPVVRIVGDKLVSSDPKTGRLSCCPAAPGAFKTHTDFPNRNPYAKRPSPQVEIALNAIEANLRAASAAPEQEAKPWISGAELQAYYAERQSARVEQQLIEKSIEQVGREMQAERIAALGRAPAKRPSYFVFAGGRVRLEDVQDGIAKPDAGCRFGAIRNDGYVEVEKAN